MTFAMERKNYGNNKESLLILIANTHILINKIVWAVCYDSDMVTCLILFYSWSVGIYFYAMLDVSLKGLLLLTNNCYPAWFYHDHAFDWDAQFRTKRLHTCECIILFNGFCPAGLSFYIVPKKSHYYNVYHIKYCIKYI